VEVDRDVHRDVAPADVAVAPDRNADAEQTPGTAADTAPGDVGAPAPDIRPTGGPHLGYRPALDGIRALGLLGIVAFHAELPGSGGAFLGVSTFFTLSGFLITSVTLADHGRTGRVPVSGFYARRARRLLPAAVAAILGTAAVTVVIGTSAQVGRMRGDALSALFYAENWHQILRGDSYGAIFESPSMFTHFWSLGIEEQFYIAFPLVVAACLWAGRGSRRVLAAVIAVVALASTAWSAHLYAGGGGVDRAYFGSDTRVAELAVGCLLALVWWRRPATLGGAFTTGAGPGAAGNGQRSNGNGTAGNGAVEPAVGLRHRVLAGAGVLALVAILVIWHQAERTTGLLYRGGLVGYALLSAVLIVAALQPVGPVRRVFSLRPLVWLGTVSYAAYLVHWPILVVLRQRTGLTAWQRFGVALALTLVISGLSARVLEKPIRARRWPAARWAPGLAGATIVVTALVIVAVAGRQHPAPAPDYQAAADKVAVLGAPLDPPPDAETYAEQRARVEQMTPEQVASMQAYVHTQEAIAASTAPRVAFFGDSSATMTAVGLTAWSIDHLDQLAPSPGFTALGCGVLDRGKRIVSGVQIEPPPECTRWLDDATATVSQYHADIAVLQFGPWDVRAQQIEQGGDYLTLGKDHELEEAMRTELDRTVTGLLDHAGVVVLVASPDIEVGREDGRSPGREAPESDPHRMAAYRAIVEQVAAAHDRVAVVDLAGYLGSRDDDNRLRPDGVHFTDDTSREVADWLGPELVRLYTAEIAASPPPPAVTTTTTTPAVPPAAG
jgi:peptidoglycan/LPS O-acetylase OafA/YrhL